MSLSIGVDFGKEFNPHSFLGCGLQGEDPVQRWVWELPM